MGTELVRTMSDDDITDNYHGGNPESIEAKELSRKNAERDRLRIMRLAGLRGPRGLTCDEAEVLLALSHQTCSARFSELKRDRLLLATRLTRPTRQEAQARVMVVRQGFVEGPVAPVPKSSEPPSASSGGRQLDLFDNHR